MTRDEVATSTRVALSVDEAAARLGVSEWTIRQAIKRGELTSRRIGHRVLVPVEAIDNFFDDAREESE